MSNQAAAISVETFNKVVEYLSNQPFSEVSGLIAEIRETAQVVDLEPNAQEKTLDEE